MSTGDLLSFKDTHNISADYQICIPLMQGIYKIELEQYYVYSIIKVEIEGYFCQDDSFWGYMKLEDFISVKEFSNTSKLAWFNVMEGPVTVTFDIQQNWSSDAMAKQTLIQNCRLCFTWHYKLRPESYFPWIPVGRGFMERLFCSHNTCYRLIRKSSYSWEDAQQHCTTLNETLVSVKTYETLVQAFQAMQEIFNR